MPKKVGWPFQVLIWYYRRPVVGYAILFLFAAYWGFRPRSGEAILLDVFLLPWVLLVLIVLHLPLFGAILERFRLPEEQRRNHALEHGTIYFLRRQGACSRRCGGKALGHGFRIWGAKREAIPPAFAAVVALEQQARWAVVVSRNCGSTVVFAQALGVLLLLLSITLFSILSLQPLMVALILALQLVFFLVARYPVGMMLQKQRLLSVSFDAARIWQIERAKANEPFESPPVFIVHTETA